MTSLRTAFLFLAGLAVPVAPAGAADYSAFRACVGEVAASSVAGTYNVCAAPLVVHCAASATAAEAANCIDAARAGLDAAIESQTARLAELDGKAADDVEEALDANRAAGEASCAVVMEHDRTSGVAVGQRAVNAAFCRLVVSGDVLGMAYRLEDGE